MVNHGLPLGGTCVNVGCVPSKHLLHVGNVYYYGGHGIKGVHLVGKSIVFAEIMRQKNALVEKLRKKKYEDVASNLSGVTVINGRATFVSPKKVEVDGEIIHGDKFIIATGASPSIAPIEGIDDVDFITSQEALELERVPSSMVIIGGRALALEFAQLFAHFGTKVRVLQRSPRILPDEEPEISLALRRYLELEGIEIHTGTKVKRVWNKAGMVAVEAVVGSMRREFRGEVLLVATGRKPNTASLGLDKAGVKVDGRGAVIVDNQMRTSAKHIWAAGDVVGKPMLETVAAREGVIAAENAIKGAGATMDYSAVPHAVFTSPQVASVGFTEARAEEKGFKCACRTVPMEAVPKAAIVNDIRGLIKMVVEEKTSRILGVHILAPLAAEMIHEATLAVRYGLTVEDIINTVHVFPTMSEGIKLAAQAFIRDITRMSCCVE